MVSPKTRNQWFIIKSLKPARKAYAILAPCGAAPAEVLVCPLRLAALRAGDPGGLYSLFLSSRSFRWRLASRPLSPGSRSLNDCGAWLTLTKPYYHTWGTPDAHLNSHLALLDWHVYP